MMSLLTCKDFLKELNEFLDDSAGPESRSELERHVNECPNCWVIVDTTKKTLQIYRGMDAQEIPEPVHNRLVAALERKINAEHR
jgi:anti-sigma factor (TIGR02949 family)